MFAFESCFAILFVAIVSIGNLATAQLVGPNAFKDCHALSTLAGIGTLDNDLYLITADFEQVLQLKTEVFDSQQPNLSVAKSMSLRDKWPNLYSNAEFAKLLSNQSLIENAITLNYTGNMQKQPSNIWMFVTNYGEETVSALAFLVNPKRSSNSSKPWKMTLKVNANESLKKQLGGVWASSDSAKEVYILSNMKQSGLQVIKLKLSDDNSELGPVAWHRLCLSKNNSTIEVLSSDDNCSAHNYALFQFKVLKAFVYSETLYMFGPSSMYRIQLRPSRGGDHSFSEVSYKSFLGCSLLASTSTKSRKSLSHGSHLARFMSKAEANSSTNATTKVTTKATKPSTKGTVKTPTKKVTVKTTTKKVTVKTTTKKVTVKTTTKDATNATTKATTKATSNSTSKATSKAPTRPSTNSTAKAPTAASSYATSKAPTRPSTNSTTEATAKVTTKFATTPQVHSSTSASTRNTTANKTLASTNGSVLGFLKDNKLYFIVGIVVVLVVILCSVALCCFCCPGKEHKPKKRKHKHPRHNLPDPSTNSQSIGNDSLSLKQKIAAAMQMKEGRSVDKNDVVSELKPALTKKDFVPKPRDMSTFGGSNTLSQPSKVPQAKQPGVKQIANPGQNRPKSAPHNTYITSFYAGANN